jgi:methionyl-tRNA formyltransferase
MAVVFFGTPDFAIPTLEALYNTGEEIALVVTQPDKEAGRGHRLTPPPVKVWAEQKGLKILQPNRIREDSFIEMLKDIEPEFIVVVAYGKILPAEVLSITKCINLHASLLPKYRGAAPIQWALINGETETGVTTMLMDEGLDTGDILLQKRIEIKENDNTLTLSERLSKEGAILMVDTLRGLRDGSITPVPQKGPSSYAPPLKKSDGVIHWHMPAVEINNRIRGLYPWPCAYTFVDGKMLKIIKAKVLEGSGEPSVVVKRDKSELVVGTGKGLLSLLLVQPEGKKVMDIKAYLQGRGRSIKVGHRLG